MRVVSHGHTWFPAVGAGAGAGAGGDWGIQHPEWGTGFMSSGFVVAHVTGDWSLAMLELARVELNQDLVVLVRR